MSFKGSLALPSSWLRAELTDLVQVHYGKSLPGELRATFGSIPVVGSSGVVGRHNQALVDGPCLVVGRKGAAGAVHYLGASCWPIDTAYFIQTPAGLSLKFLSYLLASLNLVQLEKSTAIPSLSRDDLYRVLVPVAPEGEQTRIVEKLEELLSDLDAGVAELKAAQKKLAKYRQSLLKAAVDGSLTASWREAQAQRQGEPQETGAQLLARIVAERRARWEAKQLAKFKEQGKAPPNGWRDKYPEPIAPGVSELSPLPGGWVWATIDQLAQVGTGVTPLRSRLAYFNGGVIPWVTSGALNSEIVSAATELVTELALKECRLEVYPVGSLLVAMYGEGKTRGKCSELLIPATINQAIAALVLEPESQRCKAYLKSFLLHSYEKMRGQASGGVQPNLNLQIIKTIAVPLPPLVEQAEVVQLLAAQFEQIERQQGAVERGLKQSTAQRKNILKAAFSGQLVPQDPNDEPASVLLARIRAERAAQAQISKPRGRKLKETA